jgi:uncharacterized protein YbjT (DUF2867 family)
MKIAIAAAAGNIGSQTASRVAAQGATLMLLGPRLEKLKALAIPGAILAQTDISNPDQVIAATQGADALLWLVPPVSNVPSLQGWYRQVTAAGVMAVQQNKIKRVVLISSLGAGAADNLGTVTYIGETETAFNTLDAHVLALRPGYFMENFLLQAHNLRNDGRFQFPYSPDHDIPFVSTDDIGDTAATYLLDETWAGHWTLNLMGPENITLSQAASRLAVSLGKPIQYEQLPWVAVSEQLTSWGTNAIVRQELIDLFVALGDPGGVYATPRTPEAPTSTRFETFVKNKLVPLLRQH